MPLSALLHPDGPPIGVAEYSRRLKSILEALPTGVVLAEAPNGRIVYGNSAIERMLGHPVIYSKDKHSYEEWVAFHENGDQLKSDEYPLARVLAGEERPELECRCRRADGSLLWVKVAGVPLRNEAGDVAGAIASITDIDALKAAQMQYFHMSRELHHRVNNALAMILSIANLSARTLRDPATFNETFSGRVCLLGRTQVLLCRSSWEQIPLLEVLATAVDHDLSRVALRGAAAAVPSEVALALALAVHELKINAERFGALSVPEGSVDLRWSCDEHGLRIDWEERGGPVVHEPTRCGLGLNLLQNILPPQIGGQVQVEFAPQGVRACFVLKAGTWSAPAADASALTG
ncbi:MAG TPA: HWE histidine kinase domain-containing protein [Methylocystis sp.]|nr:HWE histidine kinase domain-containing protein [Methylocystis sp.]